MSIADLVDKFRAVAIDRIETMNTLMVTLESDVDHETVDALQREIHTLKGEAKMMGFVDVNLVAHLTEHLILDSSARNFDVSAQLIGTIFEGLDILNSLLTKSAASTATPVDLVGFVERVAELRRGTPVDTDSGAFEAARAARRAAVEGGSSLRIQTSGSTRVDLPKLERLGETTGELMLTSRRIAFQLQGFSGMRSRYDRMASELGTLLPKSMVRRLRTFGHELDSWLDDARAAVAGAEQWSLVLDSQTRELRHVRLESALQHYPRAIRDLCATQGKRVRFVQNVGDVEVDRLVLNGLSDPLLHLVRNAVDHGIESPQVREAAGKPAEGKLSLEADVSGDTIRVVLSDDGAGIDPAFIGRKAVERGLIAPHAVAEMNEAALLSLIFEPGFSTRDHVTDISGRGIGMDVVRRQIGQIGGSVEIDSVVGEGTTFTLVLPVSSSVASVLAFVLDGSLYAVPAKDVERVDIVAFEDLEDGVAIRIVEGDEDDRVERRVPLLQWDKLLPSFLRNPPRGELSVVFLRRGGRAVAMWVDDVIGEHEAMTRPLGEFLTGVRVCRGVAITDAGVIVPLLNVNELLAPENTARGEARPSVRATMQLPRAEKTRRVLIVEDSEITRAVVSGILIEMGLDVTEAEDGWQAWETLLSAPPFDIVLTDVQMPRVDGLELLERVRKERRFADIPVVILSTLGEAADKQRAMDLGASAYIVKLNFEEKELERTIRRLIDM